MSSSQPEIENLGVSALGHEQVCRLDVAVNNSLRMRCIEGIGDFYSQLQQRFQLYRLCTNAMFQGYTSRNSIAMKAFPSWSPIS